MGFYEELYKNKQPSTTLKPTKTSFYEEAVSSIGKYEQQKRKLDLLEQQKKQEKPKSRPLFETAKSFVSGAKKFLFGEEKTINISKEIENDVRRAKNQLEEQKRYLINSLAFGDRKEIYKKLEELKEAEDTYNQILAKKDDETGFFRKIINKIFKIPSIQRKIQIAGELPDKYKGEYILSAIERQSKEPLKEILPFWKNIEKTINFVKKGKPLKDALRKYATNQPLTDEEKRMILTHRANSLKGTYLDNDLGSMVGDIVANMPRYMIEYALLTELGGGLLASIPSVSKLLKSAEMAKLLSKTNFVMNPLTEKATFVSVPLIPKTFSYLVANNITQSIIKGLAGGTLNIPQIGSNLQNYMIPDFYELENERKINVKKAIEILDKKSSFTDSLKKAYLSSTIEYATEGIGGIVEKPIDFVKTAILSRFINKTGLKTASSLSKFLAKAGWNGIIGEVFEEEISELLHSKVEKREYKNPFTTPEGRERLLVETLGIGAFSGLANVSEEVLRRLENRNQKEAKWDKIDAKVVEDNDKDLLKNVPDVVKEEIQKRIEEKKNEILIREIEEKEELLPEQPQPKQEEKKEVLSEQPKPIPEETEKVIKENIPEVKDIFPYQEIKDIMFNKTYLNINKRYDKAKELLEKKLKPITDKIGELQGEYANNKDEKIKEQIKLLKSVVNKNFSELKSLFTEANRKDIERLRKESYERKMKEEVKPTISKPLNKLDPRNFKTAEDYVKAHGKLVYHGGEKEIKKFGEIPESGTRFLGKGVYFTDNIDRAKEFGNVITEAVLNLKNPYKQGEEFNDILKAEIRKLYGKKGAKTAERIIQRKEPLKATEINPDLITKLYQKAGYDGVISTGGFLGAGRGDILVFNPSQIKTRSQLIEEWNKAVKKAQAQEVEKKEVKQKTTPEKTKEEVKPTIPKELEPLAQIAKKSKDVDEFITNIGKKLDELWQQIKIAPEREELLKPGQKKQSILIKEQENIVNAIKKGAEQYMTPEARTLKETQIKAWARRDAERLFLTDFYNQVMAEYNQKQTQEIKSPKPGASAGKYDLEVKSNLKKVNDYVQNIRPIEMPELVDIAKNLSKKTPVIRRLRNALGRFYEERGIALHPDIFKDTRLATRVLAHEIGHLVDYLPDKTLARGNLLGRVLTLKHFLKQSFSNEKGEIKNKTIREELTELSFAWRPLVSFSQGYLLYRRSSRELYADAISVLLNDPALLKEKAPNFWKGFFDNLDKKPEVRDELFRIWNLLASGDEKVFEKRDKAIKQMFKKAGEQAKVHMALNEKTKKNILWHLANDFDKGLFLKGKFKGIKFSPEEDPYIAYDKLNFINAQTTGFVLDEVMPIDEELQKAKISRDDFGEYLMLNRAINERGEMANPLGFTKEVAQKQIEYLKTKLGEEKFNKMLEIHDKFRVLGEKVLEYAKKNEVYSEELVERLKLNKDYATFSVIDFLDGIYIPATIREQKGTLREIANPYQATIVKYINVIKLSHLNKIRNTILSAYKNYFPDEIKPAKRRFNGKFMEVVKGKNTILTLEKGDLAGYDAPEELVNIFKKNDYLGQIAFVNALSFLKNEVFSPLFIELSAGFQSFNTLRDFFRYYKALNTYNIFTALKYYVKAFPEAVKRGFGHYSKLETEMLKKGYLNTSYFDIADKDIPDEDYILEKNLNKLGISIIEDKKKPFFLNIIKPIRVFAKSIGSTVETLPKMAGYLAMEGKVNDEELGYIVRNYLGSPNFWKYGKGYRLYNSLFLYSNAFVGATLSDIDLAFKNPKTRAGWWTKTILLNIVPKIFVLMALAGWFGDKLRKLYERIGDYSLTNYNVIPIGEDNKGRSVYITIPQDEMGRIIGGLFYKTFKGSNLLEIPKEQLKYTWEQFPSVNPLIDIAINTGAYLSGQNPYDFFYGRNVLTEDEYKAGGKHSLIPFLKWVFIKAGGRTLIRLDLMEQGEPDNFYQKTIRIPIVGDIVGRFLRVSDKGTKEKLKKTVGEIEQKEAERRLIIKQDIKEIYKKVQKGENKIELLREEIQKMTKGLNKDKRKQLANYIIKKYKLYEHYKKDDVYIDEYLIAKTNEQKAVILYEMSRNKNKDEFFEIIRTLKREKLLSDNTLQLLKKMLR